ncbi:aminopeptidase P family protein [Paraflavisolibacter sp. H34]|uniref:aminopeptidase P family protein n=1 Tax=Huijunlia imazamoxiresistens TaxID=3127457 RepID=UPI003015E2D2
MFDTQTYQQRRAVLRQQMDQGLLLFIGNEESPMNYEHNTYPFRQDSSFLYYFGINVPSVAALIDLEEGREILFGDEAGIDDLVWTGRTETLRERALKGGITDISPAADLPSFLQRARAQGRPIHFLPPYRAEHGVKLFRWLGIDPATAVEKASNAFIRAVVQQRAIKSAAEVEEIEKAVAISAEMQLLAMRTARPGMSEAELAAAVQQVAQRAGGNLAYPTILTVNGHILHNHSRENRLQEGQLVLNDCGAETPLGYCGDLTRTFPAGPRFTDRQKTLYEIVRKALDTAAGALKPGTPYLDIHFTACRTLAHGLKELGLMKGDVDEAVAAGAHALFFQCGTGHMMGMDVHDMENLGEQYVGYDETLQKEKSLFGLKSLRLGRKLQPGFVLTVEPGLYFNPFLIDLWKSENKFAAFIDYQEVEAYRNFTGIRIEDNFLVTEAGAQLLGPPLPTTIEEVEETRSLAF